MPVAVERLNVNAIKAGAGNPAGQSMNATAFTRGGDIAFGDGGGAGKQGSGDGGGAGRQLQAHEAAHVVQQGQANGFSKQGAKELMDGNVPSNAADRARLRSSIQHPGAAGAPLGAGVGSLATAKPGA